MRTQGVLEIILHHPNKIAISSSSPLLFSLLLLLFPSVFLSVVFSQLLLSAYLLYSPLYTLALSTTTSFPVSFTCHIPSALPHDSMDSCPKSSALKPTTVNLHQPNLISEQRTCDQRVGWCHREACPGRPIMSCWAAGRVLPQKGKWRGGCQPTMAGSGQPL